MNRRKFLKLAPLAALPAPALAGVQLERLTAEQIVEWLAHQELEAAAHAKIVMQLARTRIKANAGAYIRRTVVSA